MSERRNRMADHHPRARIAHHFFNIFFIKRVIAMDSTFAATPFFIAEPARIKSFGGIIGEVVALRAQVGT